jgi:hypothetical protein
MLVGTRNAVGAVSEERFNQQWKNPRISKELSTLGFETPGLLGATFMGGSGYLKGLTRDSEPLVDNYPYRISPELSDSSGFALYEKMLDTEAAALRFGSSPFIKRLWPPALIEKTKARFSQQKIINLTLNKRFQEKRYNPYQDLRFVLNETSLQTLPLWLLGKRPQGIEIVEKQYAAGERSPYIFFYKASAALSRRDYASATQLLDIYFEKTQRPTSIQSARLYIFSLCMDNRRAEANQLGLEWGVPQNQIQGLCS